MPQVGKALRGHELARDGLSSLPYLVASGILVHNLNFFPDITILRPASADELVWAGASPDQGYILPLPCTLVVAFARILIHDQAGSGTLTFTLCRNGVSTGLVTTFSSVVPPAGTLIALVPAGGFVTNFAVGDTWAWLGQHALAAGIGSQFNITTFFYQR